MYSPQITPFQPTNIDATTKMLMGLQQKGQLQQYVAQHKDDPNLVALALYVNNMSKARPAVQAEANQPKVVDQAIAQMAPQQMLPEEQGIGTLPAPNMKRMAGGGIVAFDGGGEVKHFDGSDGSYTGRGVDAPWFNGPDALPFGNYPINYAENKRLYEANKQAELDKRKAAALNIINESPEDYALRKITELEALGGKQLSPDARNKAMSNFVKEKITGQIKRGEASYTKESQLPAPATTYVDPNKPLPGLTPPGQKPLVIANQPPVVPGAATKADDDYIAGIDKLLKSSQIASTMGPMTKLDAKRYSFTPAELANIKPEDYAAALDAAMPKNPTASPFDAQQQELNKANLATRQNAKAEMEKQFKEQGLAFEDTLKKLTAKEKRVQTMEDNQLGMSLLEAGLNMMAGESPHAMVNIGKGAQAGTKKYAEIQNQIESYRDKIDDTKMKIEEYRRNEANMNARELRAAQRDIDDSVSAGAQAMINLAREQYGLNRQQAISFVSNSMQMQQFNVQQKNQAAMHNQATAAGIDTAYAQMANARDIAAMQQKTHLGLAALEAKYRKENPAAGSLGFYKMLGGGDPVKGLKIYSENLGPEAKGDEALLLAWSKLSEPEKMLARKTDPMGSAMKDRMLQQRMLQGSVTDRPAGTVLDQPR